MNERTYKRKDENFISLGINAGGIIDLLKLLYENSLLMVVISATA